MNKYVLITESQFYRISKNFFIKNEIFFENKKQFVNFLLNEIKEELDFQKKVHLHHLSMLKNESKINYLKKIENDYVHHFFGYNDIIVEEYKNNFEFIITESINELSNRIEKFNSFILHSFIFQNNMLKEQDGFLDNVRSGLNAVGNAVGQAYDYGKEKATQAYNYVADELSNAVSYIKDKGIGYVMENIRTALMTDSLQAIQTALAFTGPGAIATEIVWAIMTLYDSYQYFVNGASIMNLIISLICLLTAGTLGRIFGPYLKSSFTTIDDALKYLITSPIGKYIKNAMSTIKSALQSVSGLLTKAVNFMETKMGITWVKNLIQKVVTFCNNLVDKILKIVETGVESSAAYVGKKLVSWNALKTAGTLVSKLGPKLETKIMSEIAKLSPTEIGKYATKKIKSEVLNQVDDYVKKNLVDKPIDYALSTIDKYFGEDISDLYANYAIVKNVVKSRT